MESVRQAVGCFHCGSETSGQTYVLEGKSFCCNGCRTVFQILQKNDLGEYYQLNSCPGLSQRNEVRQDKYAFLDDEEIARKLVHFSDGKQAQLILYLPQIHCSSCLYILEQLNRLNVGVIASRVNFERKEVFISYNLSKTSLRKVAETLDSIGYEPHLSLNDIQKSGSAYTDKSRIYKIGIAGFCFANIMIFSFADYLAIQNTIDAKLHFVLKFLSIALSIPVLFYAATEFFTAAWKGLKNGYLNIDFPVALALSITFIRSLFEILSGTGGGYLDSMSGIVFFMLIGRWLQSRTHSAISFDRDYKSFFPIAVVKLSEGQAVPTEVSKLKEHDLIRIHSNEIIPVDAMVSKGKASIDYSFVVGESQPSPVSIGEIVYAGGRQTGGMLELVVLKEVSQSYLTNLWNQSAFNDKSSLNRTTYDLVGAYFTYAVLLIGIAAGTYWGMKGNTAYMWNAITTVLIVACPCALLLSQNYTNGNILRIFGQNRFYLRSAEIIDRIANIDHIVFDKTGTLTQSGSAQVMYFGPKMAEKDLQNIASMIKQSTHPVNKSISEFINVKDCRNIEHFVEHEGLGMEAWIDETHYKMGSPTFIGGEYQTDQSGSKVVLYKDGVITGEFVLRNKYRFGMQNLFKGLKSNFSLSLLSGDNDFEKQNITRLMGPDCEVLFQQSPQQKLDYVTALQNEHHLKVMMIGDGLNDAGALRQSEVGIAVVEDNNVFTPSSDGIIEASRLSKLASYIQFAKSGKKIIFATFWISVAYNLIGLFFAVQGILSPVIAAILMPCSSITIIFHTYGLTEWLSRKYGLREDQNVNPILSTQSITV